MTIFSFLRRQPPPVDNTQVVKVYPVSVRDRKLCQAEPWGSDGYRRCPFLRDGTCRLWGWNIHIRPDKVETCPVTEVVVPLPPD